MAEKMNHSPSTPAPSPMQLNDKKSSDVCFVVGDRRIYAHRAVLAGRAGKLEAMFKPAKAKQTLKITDIEADIFYEVLRYIYTGKLDIPKFAIHCSEVFTAAGELEVWDLDEMCAYVCQDLIARAINLETAVEHLQFGQEQDAWLVKERALKFIVEHAKTISRTKEFEQLDAALLRDIVRAMADSAAKQEGSSSSDPEPLPSDDASFCTANASF